VSDVILIFTHFGYSDYLEYTLSCARKTNPNARLVLLGDAGNVDVALRHGWEHYAFTNFKSRFHDHFSVVFRHVQGARHNPYKNGSDWLRYVFERWLFIDAFLQSESIDRFWHFDSDTMVLQDLQPYEHDLRAVDFTVQCNNTCLNGLVSAPVVSEFCEHVCNLYENAEFIESQQREFDTVNPHYAFTEMRAFDHYKSMTNRPWVHLMTYRDDKAFDDCICQGHGFQMVTLPSNEVIKSVYSRGGNIYGIREGREVEFVTLNLSWVPNYLFEWVLEAISGIDLNVKQSKCPLDLRIRGVARKIKRLLKNAI